MLRKYLSALWSCAFVLLLAAGAVSCSAPSNSTKGPLTKDGDQSALDVELVKTGLYLISGGGGNSLLRFSATGLILVNGKLPGNYRNFMSQVRKISKMSDLPVRVLIVTDHQENHTGNNAEFIDAGVPIIAQENIKTNLKLINSFNKQLATSPPIIKFSNNYKLRIGGIEVLLKHFGDAHTNGDTVVYFPNLKVVAVGDLYTPNTPDPDYLRGGSLVNWGPVLDQILALDFDVVVPSTGSTVTRADLEAFKAKIDTVVFRASGLIKKGVPKDQFMAQLKTDDLSWQFNFNGDHLDHFYSDLIRAK